VEPKKLIPMQLFKKWLVSLVLLVTAASQLYPAGYNLRVRVEGLQDTTLLLAYHLGNRKFIKDTIRVDNSGYGVFSGPDALPGGIYLVVLPEMNFFEIVIDREQDFLIETSLSDPAGDLKITGSGDNRAFLEYHRFMNEMQKASAGLRERLQKNQGNADSVEYLRNRLSGVDRQVQDYWNDVTTRKPATLLSSLIRAMQNPEVPEFEIPAGTPNPDSVRWFMGYRYNKAHFFDGVDFSDERLLRTPVLHNKLDHFFNRVLIQAPDSIIPEAIRVVEYSRANEKVFQYVLVYLINHYERSQIMGMDAVFVELAERYYLTGLATWANEETIKKLSERVERLKPNLIGRTAAEMKMRTPGGNFVSLHNTEARYIILYFYEPGCGHCREVTPRLNDLYNKYRHEGLEVFGIYIYDDADEWTEYIKKNNLGWVNVFDPDNSTYFRFFYDIYSTPTIYVLDADKTIIAKRIGIESVEMMMEELL
jgi:thiol-disulfide isomerase/thioredoxin